MANLDAYVLKIRGLGLGEHHFEYEVGDDFWANFEGSEVSRGEVKVGVEVSRGSSMLELDFDMRGEVEVACDRCLGRFMMPVDYAGTLLVKFAEDPPESDGDILWLHPVEGEVNLAQYIYESIVLSLPFQRVHPDPADCDPEVLKYLRTDEE